PASQEVIMVRISVFYATAEGKKFDHDYYVNRHMKLVRERLGSFGLVRTEVDKGVAGGAPGAPAPYVAIGHVYFNSLDGFQKGMGQHAKEIMGDVPNYTNIQPQIQISEIIG
ncbi:MAG TPA: EthD family reductase, partial [Candidatus Binatia bacterium]|nr:EthD family reductase [Candidatus Binatia bacterium]